MFFWASRPDRRRALPTMIDPRSFVYLNPIHKTLLTFGVGLALCALL